MRLSVIIVNYKTAGLVLDCLASLYCFDMTGVEVFVVDNDSGDGLENILKEKYPAAIFISTGYNAGFARANNAAMRVAAGENILLLNSDTINFDDAVNRCDLLLRDLDYAAAGVQLLNEDRTPQISGSHAIKGGINCLLPLPYLGTLFKAAGNLFKIKKPSIEKAGAVTEVDWINGAFLMVKKKCLADAGLMDEDFFLYAEETEWCSRIKKTGKLCVFGELHVLHLQGASANNAFSSEGQGYYNLFDRKGLQIMLGNFLRIRKEFGKTWFLFNLFFYYLDIPVFFAGVFFSGLFFPKSRKFNLKQARGFTINMVAMTGFVPRIIRNEPFFYKVV